jgi:hypothetical protein
MTTHDMDMSNPAAGSPPIAGHQSAGTTTLLRQCMSELIVSELMRNDPVVQSLLQPAPGARS